MLITLIVGLIGVSLYLLKRVSDTNTENAALRDQIASLKRKLVTRRG
jgi:hypothetical protein